MSLLWPLLQGSECCCLLPHSPLPLVTISCLPQDKPWKILQEVFPFPWQGGFASHQEPWASLLLASLCLIISPEPPLWSDSRGKGNQSTAVRSIHQASLTGQEHSTGAVSAFPGSSASQSNIWLSNTVFFLCQKFITCITLLNFYFSIHKGRKSMLMLKKK